MDKAGALYWWTTLKQKDEQRCIDISMLGYVKKLLAEFKHKVSKRPRYNPY
jgi:hypothetical protein